MLVYICIKYGSKKGCVIRMKKITSILFGVILIVCFVFTGCQSGMEREIFYAAARPSVPKIENKMGANRPEQTVRNLKIMAEGAPVEVRLASDGQYSYKYNKDAYAVTTATSGSTFKIKVTGIRAEADGRNKTNVIVYIPNQKYKLITGVSRGSSLILPAINANISVKSDASSIMVKLPSNYNKKLNYTGNASSCVLSMSDVNDFAVKAKISTSAVSVQNDWPAYDMFSSSYNYTSGNGTAKINIDIASSSFMFA